MLEVTNISPSIKFLGPEIRPACKPGSPNFIRHTNNDLFDSKLCGLVSVFNVAMKPELMPSGLLHWNPRSGCRPVSILRICKKRTPFHHQSFGCLIRHIGAVGNICSCDAVLLGIPGPFRQFGEAERRENDTGASRGDGLWTFHRMDHPFGGSGRHARPKNYGTPAVCTYH